MTTRSNKKIIAIAAPVAITAGEAEGEKKGPAKFTSTFYTGGALNIEGWDLPVVVDLAGLSPAKVLVANQYHDQKRPVGNFDVENNGQTLVANGTATAATEARDEVVNSALAGYKWQASLEVNPKAIETVKAGKSVAVNGQTFEGPLYVTRKGVLKGFGFVSHGADDNTTATIAASAAPNKERVMKAEVKTWAEGMGIDVDNATPDQLATIEANYEGRNGKKPTVAASSNPFESRKIEAKRRTEIRQIADKFIERREGDLEHIEAIEKMHDHAIEGGMSVQDFRNELYESMVPLAHTVPAPRTRDRGITGRVLEAALCQAGNLGNIDKCFSDQELQTAHDMFRDGISLNQFLIIAAESNGYRGSSGGKMNLDIQRAAFGMTAPGYASRDIKAFGFSTIDVANVVAATANKFLHEGWMHVDMTPLRIANIRSVRNFQQVTTVSLTGHLTYEKVGPAGEIKDGVLDDLTYTNQIDTYGLKLAITRQDMINDDLSALTAVPRRLGRGGALKLNDIFWTEFLGLVGSGFFAAGNNNINTAVADMSQGGLEATETIFLNQTDPDGKPVGFMPQILLVPTALKAKAAALMSTNPGVFITGSDTTKPAANVFAGRFRVESSPYISNSSYSGYTSVAWWMLADPKEAAVIEIAALNGKVEPTIETVQAPFGYLGIGMQGYSDIGVNEQEKRAGVHADGGTS